MMLVVSWSTRPLRSCSEAPRKLSAAMVTPITRASTLMNSPFLAHRTVNCRLDPKIFFPRVTRLASSTAVGNGRFARAFGSPRPLDHPEAAAR